MKNEKERDLDRKNLQAKLNKFFLNATLLIKII